ncbi:MAG TPA: DNA polymerase III subunit delta [Streptosporangiaceae bacterium]|nr:DNA polymerase III subunit delta [Streptosporangiaceae bacterium]
MPARQAAAPGASEARQRVSLVTGEETLLVDRAVARLTAAARGSGADVRHVTAAGLQPGELTSLAAPSLFGDVTVLVVHDAQDAGKEAATELTRLAGAPPPDVTLVVTHAGGVKGKALLTSLKPSAGEVVECPKVTRASDRMAFVREEFRAAGRKADEAGVRALLDALGTDLSEIASACAQLMADTTGAVDQRVVAQYYRGRAEASGFSVADRAVEGRLSEALELLRWALAVGVSPVLVTSGLAQALRLLGRVGSAPRGVGSAALAAEVGAAPWRIDKARHQLSGWAPAGIATALAAVAEADAQVKGEGTNAGYALEVAVRAIVAARASGAAVP